MKKMSLLFLGMFAGLTSVAQQPSTQEIYEKLWAQEAAEAVTFYAGADTAAYGIRYLWTYLYDKEHKRVYKEDRVVWVSPRVTLDMSYQSIGEKKWLTGPVKDRWYRRDPSLAYHLTPSFYFYYPKERRQVHTYRVVSEEFLLQQGRCTNEWNMTDEHKEVGGYPCRKAVCRKEGRVWIAWFTDRLPYVAAPRQLDGLPGVVLEAYDEHREIKWEFKEQIAGNEGAPFFIKYPERFSSIAVDKFPLILKLYARSTPDYVQKAGVMNKTSVALPEKLLPSTGVDACAITNPIALDKNE